MNDWTLYECIYVLAFLGGITIISAISVGTWSLLKWLLDKAVEASQKPKKAKCSRYTFIQQLKYDYSNYKAYKDYSKRQKGRKNENPKPLL